MNSLLYYYNNVQKMAAYRQAKRMQRGVKLGYMEVSSHPLATKFTIPPIQIGMSDFTFEYYGNAYGSAIVSNSGLVFQQGIIYTGSLDIGFNEVYYVSLANIASRHFRWRAQTDDEKFHLVIARIGSTYTVTINNVLQDTVDMGEVKDLGNFSPVIINSSDVGFVRVWNYALSADDIATLYNNNDPMGYVVPKAMRYFPDVSFLGPEGDLIWQSYTWTNSPEDNNFFRYNFKQSILLGQRLKVQITVSDYEAGNVQFDGAFGGKYYGQNGIRANGTYVFITNALNSTAYTSYGRVWCTDEGQGRKCTVSVDSVEVVGLLAEYLPQNLMYGRDDKTIATSWLDSAKQLPLSDEYMEPLFQSIGGYDMAANGAPEILYNE